MVGAPKKDFHYFSHVLMLSAIYKISKNETSILKIKGSKFLAFSFNVETEIEIKQILAKIKNDHPSANHHCFAWTLGDKKIVTRASDDGEPANTAGKPILAQIQSHQLINCLIIVVRYFGGTLLGVNGLINAYKDAASLVIEKSGLTEVFLMDEYLIEFDFESMSKVMRTLKILETKILSNNFENNYQIRFQIKQTFTAQLIEQLKDNYTVKLTPINNH